MNPSSGGAVSGNLFASLAVDYFGFENYKLPGTFSAAFDRTSDPGYTDLVISYTAAPEPIALALLAPRRCRVRAVATPAASMCPANLKVASDYFPEV